MNGPVQLGWQNGEPLEALVSREWLVTNGLGGYASGTIGGAVTRRFHGKLIAALPSPHGRTMMLNHLAEVVRLPDGKCFHLNAQEKPARDFAPRPMSARKRNRLPRIRRALRYMPQQVLCPCRRFVIPDQERPTQS